MNFKQFDFILNVFIIGIRLQGSLVAFKTLTFTFLQPGQREMNGTQI